LTLSTKSDYIYKKNNMKNTLLYIALSIVLLSCGEKTAENSKYKSQINELNALIEDVKFNIYDFKEFDMDSLKEIRKTAEAKYATVNNVYNNEQNNIEHETTILVYKEKLIDGLIEIDKRYEGILKEHEIIIKQIHSLNENLIHETFSNENSKKYFQQEKNALHQLNSNLKTFNNYVSHVFEINDSINLKMDSIIIAHEQNF